jgi:hypothetical protein
MRKRLIAFLVAAALTGWADSIAHSYAMATMRANLGAHAIHQHEATEQAHACCPRAQAKNVPITAEAVTNCGTDHRCCFVQGRKEPSSLPISPQPRTAAVLSAVIDGGVFALPGVTAAAQTIPIDSGYHAFNDVLRI